MFEWVKKLIKKSDNDEAVIQQIVLCKNSCGNKIARVEMSDGTHFEAAPAVAEMMKMYCKIIISDDYKEE